MTMDPAWPLHPPPKEIETLRQYVQSIARLYGVTFESFCYYALKIAHADEEARSFTQPTEEVLEHLSVGLGIPIDELRGFEARRRRNVARLYAELEALIATPEGRQKFEQTFPTRMSQLGTPLRNA